MRVPEPVSAADGARRRLSPWVIAIIVGLLVVGVANAIFIWIAVSGADPIDPSYVTEPR